MIRIQVTPKRLIELINAEDAGWIKAAKERTRQYKAARKYTGGPDFWGRIKRVYIQLQHEKCAYCETKLQGSELASKVHEVEHFRPKSSIKAWPDRKRSYWKDFPAGITTGAADPKGYYLLAYHPFNYAIACTRCNSTLKSNYFPIRGKRKVTLADPSQDAAEDCLLVYPLSTIADNPKTLITFDGVLAVPCHPSGKKNERAVATIWFFQLNHEDLTTRRAEMLVPLWNMLEHLRKITDADERKATEDFIAQTCGARGQFSACMSAFRALYEQDRKRARAKFTEALKIWERSMGTPPPGGNH